eukprot:8649494-Alexandrium_andersonii.AAC.1
MCIRDSPWTPEATGESRPAGSHSMQLLREDGTSGLRLVNGSASTEGLCVPAVAAARPFRPSPPQLVPDAGATPTQEASLPAPCEVSASGASS